MARKSKSKRVGVLIFLMLFYRNHLLWQFGISTYNITSEKLPPAGFGVVVQFRIGFHWFRIGRGQFQIGALLWFRVWAVGFRIGPSVVSDWAWEGFGFGQSGFGLGLHPVPKGSACHI